MGVGGIRDLTYLACLVTQPDYLLITHEALGLESGIMCGEDYPINVAAWAELMYVLRLEEGARRWPHIKGMS